jgi:hypothetical protein
MYLARASLNVKSPFPHDFTGNPLVPGRNQRSVTYVVSHDGYRAPLSVSRAGTLEVVWTAYEAKKPITLATGQGSYHAAGARSFHVQLTRVGRALLTRTTKLTFWVAGWYGHTVTNHSWLCLYEVTENSAHNLVFSNACGP